MNKSNLNNFYVYCLFNCEWNEPFYIGKGSGDRYKQFTNRSDHVQAILRLYHCEPRILLNNLTEDEAYRIERELKESLKLHGKPIIDYEIVARKAAQRRGIEAARKRGQHLGRPPIAIPDNWDDIYKKWKTKDITAKDAMTQLGLKSATFYNMVKKYETGGIK